MILVSITGNKLRIKLGSSGSDLCTPLVEWIKNSLESGPLVNWLENDVSIERFGRESEMNRFLSEWSDVRIVFGSDLGCEEVSKLPCKENSRTYLFSNKVSQIWCSIKEMDENKIKTLIKVFFDLRNRWLYVSKNRKNHRWG